METRVQFAKDLIKCLSGVAFEAVKYNDKAIMEYLTKTMDGLLTELPFIWERVSTYRLMQPNCIYQLRTEIGIQYFVFLSQEHNYLFFLGPSRPEHVSENSIRKRIAQFDLPKKTETRFLHQLTLLPTLSDDLLYQTCNLLMQHLIDRNITVSHQILDFHTDLSQPHSMQKGDEIPKMRQIETRYEISSMLTEAIKQGNLSMALSLLRDFQLGQTGEIRNANPLRNFQNYCIILNTQLRHALENAGIHPYRLDKLSSQIGIEIENLQTLESAKEFVFLTLQKYCRLVQENAYPNLKPLVHLAVTYIKEHLNEDLTVKETAHILGVNANYLSTQFHESMGLTFIDFVHRERTRQAAALLTNTNLQIGQIASAVGYNNTSYFAKQFLRFQNMNPSQFRKVGAL